jgi:hypothetical protein
MSGLWTTLPPRRLPVLLKRRDYLVSNLQQAVTSVGPANIAQAEAKSMREIKRDIEATLASDNEMTVENGAGTPYGMRGLGKWIQSSAQATNPVPADYRTPSGSILSALLPKPPSTMSLVRSSPEWRDEQPHARC